MPKPKHPSVEGFRFVYRYKHEADAQDHAAALRSEGWETRIVPDFRAGKKGNNYQPKFEVWRRREAA